MWICKAVFALAVVLFTVKAQELEETEGKKFYVKSVRNWFLRKFIFSLLHMGCSHCRQFFYKNSERSELRTFLTEGSKKILSRYARLFFSW